MNLDPQARMNLMKFVCSFAWTDLKVTQDERDLVMRMSGRLGLSGDETKQVAQWLEVPPAGDEVDPTMVPAEHRQMFLTAVEAMTKADGQVPPAEQESLALFRELLGE
ncbi:MAG: TerB family tellurite resistance protein [bacterium]|nr:TerB family tellurite resistance protein [bacterium]